jgi:membrane protease YdiL (CAAX protease family)
VLGWEEVVHVSTDAVDRRGSLVLYFVLAYGISWGGSLAVAGPKFFRGIPLGLDDVLAMAPLVLAGPFVAGILLTALSGGWRGLRDLLAGMGRWRVGVGWYAVALLTFPALIFLVLQALSILVSPDFTPGFLWWGIFGGLAAGFIEETGWTGFAYPRMARTYGIWRATFALAILHGIWHAAPGYLGESEMFGPLWLPRFIAMWIVAMTAMRIILVWIYENTGSLLLAQLTHASSTGFLLILGPAATTPAQGTLWFAVYGVVLWIVAAIAIIDLRRRSARQAADISAPVHEQVEGKLRG